MNVSNNKSINYLFNINVDGIFNFYKNRSLSIILTLYSSQNNM